MALSPKGYEYGVSPRGSHPFWDNTGEITGVDATVDVGSGTGTPTASVELETDNINGTLGKIEVSGDGADKLGGISIDLILTTLAHELIEIYGLPSWDSESDGSIVVTGRDNSNNRIIKWVETNLYEKSIEYLANATPQNLYPYIKDFKYQKFMIQYILDNFAVSYGDTIHYYENTDLTTLITDTITGASSNDNIFWNIKMFVDKEGTYNPNKYEFNPNMLGGPGNPHVTVTTQNGKTLDFFYDIVNVQANIDDVNETVYFTASILLKECLTPGVFVVQGNTSNLTARMVPGGGCNMTKFI